MSSPTKSNSALTPSPLPAPVVEGARGDANRELIARLKFAAGPDRNLDCDIFEATQFPTDYFGSKIESWGRDTLGGYTINTADGIRHLEACRAPWYTLTFDGAKALLPSGYYWHAGEGKTRDDEPFGAASIIEPGTLNLIAEAEHASFIIAFCIACLKARAFIAKARAA